MSATLPAAVCPTCREYVSWGRCECEGAADEFAERREALAKLEPWLPPHEYAKRLRAIAADEDAAILERAAELEAAELCREAA